MSEPDLLPEVLPAAENSAPVSAIRDRQRPMVNATCSVRHCRFTSWSDFFCTYPDHGSSPCADIGSCRHFTIPPGCHAVTPAMRSAVLSAPIMRHSKSGGVTECLLSRAVGGDSLLFHSNCSHSGCSGENMSTPRAGPFSCQPVYFLHWCSLIFTIPSSLIVVLFWVITTAFRFSFNR